MNNILYAYLLSTIAGMSSLIGLIPIFLKKTKENKIIPISLFFASGVMITISIIDLIPESFSLLKNKFYLIPSVLILLIFIMIGFIISSIIDKKTSSNDNLYRVGIISMIAIIIHNIPEGIASFLTSNTNIGLSLIVAISCHNIPEGISISVPIYYSTKSKFKAFLYTFISGLSEIFGAFIAHIFLFNKNINIMSYLLAIIAGIMLQISIFELIPTACNYKLKKGIIYIILGIIFMYITHILLK